MKKLLLAYFFTFWSLSVLGQHQSVYAPLNQDYYHLIDRQEVLNKDFSSTIHSSFKPYQRVDIYNSVDSISTNEVNENFLLTDNWEYGSEELARSKKPFLKWFYQTKPDLYQVNTKDFMLKVNPVLYLAAGHDTQTQGTPFLNTRGVEIRGSIDEKIGFYSFVGENQALFPQYVQNYTTDFGVVPNEAFWKKYGEEGGVDFLTARGYFTFQATKHIGFQFGHDKNFIGNGYRSLVHSNFSAPSTFLKFQTKIWKIQYTGLYTELIADAPYSSFGTNGTKELPRKFMTSHHLSINITDNFNIGFYEAIMFNRSDSTGSAFDWTYLNPIIFYRAIEQYTGSPDNVIVGMDFKWNIVKGVQFYGQFLLDELVISELKANNGWWGNKFSSQVGLKYFDAIGIKNLDLQAEFNLSRPFTYSHESIFTNFAHYRQPIAHPTGANFKELILIGRYQPLKYLYLTAKVVMSNYGTDPTGENFGGNVLKNYNTRTQEYGNTIGQGNANDLLFVDLTASYMLRHNLFIDLKNVYRKNESADEGRNLTSNYISMAVRLNIAARDYSF